MSERDMSRSLPRAIRWLGYAVLPVEGVWLFDTVRQIALHRPPLADMHSDGIAGGLAALYLCAGGALYILFGGVLLTLGFRAFKKESLRLTLHDGALLSTISALTLLLLAIS